jgi:hypothetical protein
LSTATAAIAIAASSWVTRLATLSSLAATATLVVAAGEVRRGAVADPVLGILDIMAMLISKQM